MTTHKTLYWKNDIDRLYVSRRESERFASIEDCIDVTIQEHEGYVNKNKRRFMISARNFYFKQFNLALVICLHSV